MRVIAGLLAVCCLLAPVVAPMGAGGDSRSEPPPAALKGARSVSLRTTSGGFQRFTTIPRSSMFVRHGEGTTRTCSFTASRDDFLLSDGRRVPRGTKVTSNYLFVEGIGVPFVLPPAALPEDTTAVTSRGPLARGRRTFSVYCDRTWYDVNFMGTITVPFTDTLLDPRTQLDRLYQHLQLERPHVAADPVVESLGGLLTRHPSWLAIAPGAWRTQQSAPVHYRGLVLLLIAQPRRLDFDIEFLPDPSRPSRPFRGRVSCLTGPSARSSGGALPARPDLPLTAEPGIGGPCTWTPPGPGRVTAVARLTYGITFWASGFTAAEPAYVWSSPPQTFQIGELTAVNTDPGP